MCYQCSSLRQTSALTRLDFVTVSFTNAEVDGSAGGNSAPTQLSMGTKAKPKDATSALSGGNAFDVTWVSA